jgi:hypothetical protein
MYLLLLLFITLVLVLVLDRKSTSVSVSEQTGGSSRADLFARFNYMPVRKFISRFTEKDPRLSKHYNKPGRLKIIMGRPYRFYSMAIRDGGGGEWGYPWHFPEYSDIGCLRLSSFRCNEKIDLSEDFILPTKCFDEVYKQCRSGIPPLRIKVPKVFV